MFFFCVNKGDENIPVFSSMNQLMVKTLRLKVKQTY